MGRPAVLPLVSVVSVFHNREKYARDSAEREREKAKRESEHEERYTRKREGDS